MSSTTETIIVTAEDLPQWSMHPRVFLDIASKGEVSCPYCSAHYKLKEGEKVHGH